MFNLLLGFPIIFWYNTKECGLLSKKKKNVWDRHGGWALSPTNVVHAFSKCRQKSVHKYKQQLQPEPSGWRMEPVPVGPAGGGCPRRLWPHQGVPCRREYGAGLLRHRGRGPGITPDTGPGALLPGWNSLEVPRSPQHAPWAVSGEKISWQHCTLSCRDHTVATSLGFSVYLKASALKIPYDHKK